MTIIKYLRESGIGEVSEILGMAKVDPAGFNTLKTWAREEMMRNNVPIDEEMKQAA